MPHLAPAHPSQRSRRQRAIAVARADLLPSPEDALHNLQTVLAAATPHQYRSGMVWYATAAEHAATLADEYHTTDTVAAGVIAALSPQTPFTLNIQYAGDALAAGTANDVPHFGDAVRKANAILAGADPADVLRGRKVRSFYSNILRPFAPGPVTVDRHAVSILHGTPLYGHAARVERPGHYHAAAATYRTAARHAGILPHECQAIAWLVWRDAHAAGWSALDPF